MKILCSECGKVVGELTGGKVVENFRAICTTCNIDLYGNCGTDVSEGDGFISLADMIKKFGGES